VNNTTQNKYKQIDTMEDSKVKTALIPFERFGRGRKEVFKRTNNCVIYTRVSTKEQADNNLSLETQKKACVQYAEKNHYNIQGYFGGTYESAKTDERKEFNKMLSFVRKSKEKVSTIFVYSVDRFSRSGTNAMYIADTLKKEGIVLFAVTQPADTTTSSGRLQQNIQFIFSEYDNQLRKEKCMAGVKEKLLNGIWCAKPPLGYDILRKNGKKEFVLNKTGKLLAKAFKWKAQGMSSEEVRRQLAELGLALPNQRVSDFLRNPFYCGLIVHNALEGKVLEGVQEKAVSKEMFLTVNGMMSVKHKAGYSLFPENEEAPLKRLLKCETCNRYLTAYKARKNQKYYYKCRTAGCNCNKRADKLHEDFLNILGAYQLSISEEIKQLLKQQMLTTYRQLTKEKEENKLKLTHQINELVKKICRLEERYVSEEIDRDVFIRFKEKFIAERKELELCLEKFSIKVSNLENSMERILDISSKLTDIWHSSDYGEKQKLQNLIFPDGICYNKKTDGCRTLRVNSVISYNAQWARVLAENKNGNKGFNSNVPVLVGVTGVEPVTLCL
jgi:site-specific DNA recombinase